MGFAHSPRLKTIETSSATPAENPFEEEDARKYIRKTLKQKAMSLEEYCNLFGQKRERSRMEDVFLIDTMKANINYATQTAAISYRLTGSKLEPVTLDEKVLKPTS